VANLPIVVELRIRSISWGLVISQYLRRTCHAPFVGFPHERFTYCGSRQIDDDLARDIGHLSSAEFAI
jgi:hypothetical protein